MTTLERIEVTVPGVKDKFASWMLERGGVLIWHSQDLSDPGAQTFTPAQDEKGHSNLKSPPHWKFTGCNPECVTDLTRFRFAKEMKEVQRFHVAVRMGDSGLRIKCTDASTAKIRKACAKWTDQYKVDAAYRFDYETQEAVIEVPIFED